MEHRIAYRAGPAVPPRPRKGVTKAPCGGAQAGERGEGGWLRAVQPCDAVTRLRAEGTPGRDHITAPRAAGTGRHDAITRPCD